MKDYQTPKLLIRLFSEDVLTEILSSSAEPISTDHEHIGSFSGSWFNN